MGSRLVHDVKQGVELFGEGFDFICYSGDVWVLQSALAAGEELDNCLKSFTSRLPGFQVLDLVFSPMGGQTTPWYLLNG